MNEHVYTLFQHYHRNIEIQNVTHHRQFTLGIKILPKTQEQLKKRLYISEPTLELHSRAVSSVGVMYRSSGHNTESNPGGGRILKKSPLIK